MVLSTRIKRAELGNQKINQSVSDSQKHMQVVNNNTCQWNVRKKWEVRNVETLLRS